MQEKKGGTLQKERQKGKGKKNDREERKMASLRAVR